MPSATGCSVTVVPAGSGGAGMRSQPPPASAAPTSAYSGLERIKLVLPYVFMGLLASEACLGRYNSKLAIRTGYSQVCEIAESRVLARIASGGSVRTHGPSGLVYETISRLSGFSRYPMIDRTNLAASAPSITRW